MERRPSLQLPLALAVLLLALAGCSGEKEPESAPAIDPQWYAALDSAVEAGVGPIPKLGAGECPLGTPEIAGQEVAGESEVGASEVDGSRRRLVCRWDQSETELVVIRFEDAAELRSAREELAEVGERDLGVSVQTTEKITVDGHEVVVRRTVEPANADRTSYYAAFFDDAGVGMATLDLAGTNEFAEEYTSQQAAEDLTALIP